MLLIRRLLLWAAISIFAMSNIGCKIILEQVLKTPDQKAEELIEEYEVLQGKNKHYKAISLLKKAQEIRGLSPEYHARINSQLSLHYCYKELYEPCEKAVQKALKTDILQNVDPELAKHMRYILIIAQIGNEKYEEATFSIDHYYLTFGEEADILQKIAYHWSEQKSRKAGMTAVLSWVQRSDDKQIPLAILLALGFGADEIILVQDYLKDLYTQNPNDAYLEDAISRLAILQKAAEKFKDPPFEPRQRR